MRRVLVAALLGLVTGCGSINGPFAARKPERVDDPHYTIEEQKARGRDRLALPEESTKMAPSTYGDFPLPDGTHYGR